MPFIGAGLHIILAIFCAVHAVRTGKPNYWLFILFVFPLLGSVVYLLAFYLPSARMERTARRAVTSVAYRLDPERGVRAAREAYDQTPTAQHRMQLALALIDAGRATEAVAEYEACLVGPFATDPEIRFGSARAYLACDRYADALRLLGLLEADRPDYRSEEVALLRARSLVGLGNHAEAEMVLDAAVARFGSFATRAEQATWQYMMGRVDSAEATFTSLEVAARRWGAETRELNAEISQRLMQARKKALPEK